MPAKMKTTIGVILLFLFSTGAQAIAVEKSAARRQWFRDPFRYGSQVPGRQAQGIPDSQKAQEVRVGKELTGIFVSNGNYRALYGGRLVSPGDRVGSTYIREITLYAVIIEDSTGRRKIELFHEK
ncbi:MAG: hypothetical protein CVU69_04870 [Deltaproteobacteria bacterium HGW-Deltaproteobacteria-4]|nr:MAG: hypothetical protein CVU69_04870 [Deltaproteobacteria bacterium HGW-Deltaproteobacteria-4]